MVIKFGKWLTRHKAVVLIIAFLLLIPATIGYVSTQINYDLLSYLPNSLETVSGQDTMVDEFGMGAFSMVVVEDMEKKDIVALKEKLKKVNHVEDVIWYDDAMDITVPTEMLPDKLREGLFNGNATMMIALFDNTTSADSTMDAITEMRGIVKKQAFISGMSGVVTDIKNLAMAEMPIYVVVAAVLSLLILLLTMDSLVTPFIFLLGIGMAIVYNMGTNMVFGEISYITQALTAILQLGVTMDYSIFLLESYEANKVRYDGDKNRAMAHAISNTFTSVTSSSITTIAGFAALCFMTFKLGMDLKNDKANEGCSGYTKEERDCFSALLNSGFIDSFRYKNPDKEEYSWWSYRFKARERNAGWRIDYFVVSEKIKDKIQEAYIRQDILGSDHCPVVLEINL